MSKIFEDRKRELEELKKQKENTKCRGDGSLDT